MLCNTCRGAGRVEGSGIMAFSSISGNACLSCQGRGYSGSNQRSTVTLEAPLVGKVMAYDAQMGAAVVQLEHSLHQGDELMVLSNGTVIKFKAGNILVSGMRLQLALSGWEVRILVPGPLAEGAWILGAEEI